MGFLVSRPGGGGSDGHRAASCGVGVSGARRRRVVRAVLGPVLCGVAVGLWVVWGAGIAGASNISNQLAPIPFGTPMLDGSVAVCSVGFLDLGPVQGLEWAEGVQYFAVCNASGAGQTIYVHVPAASGITHGGDVVDPNQWGSEQTDLLGQWSGCQSAGFGTGYDCSTPMVSNSITDLPGFCAYFSVTCSQPYGGYGYALFSDLGDAGAWSCTDSAGPCEIDVSLGVANGQPSEPWPYWSGQAVSSDTNPALDCSVQSFDESDGAYVVFAEWHNVPTLLANGFVGTTGMVITATDVAGQDMPLTNRSNDLVVTDAGIPWTGNNDLAGDFLGNLTNPDDLPSWGSYTFTVGAWEQATSAIAPTVVSTAVCLVSSKGITPPGATVCPNGPGTCANPASCVMTTDTVQISFPFLLGTISVGSVSFPDPMAVPSWVGCEFEQLGEWAAFPTEGVLTTWQAFGSDARTHTPAAYVYDGSSWLFTFANQLHGDIPGDYVGSPSACFQITPSSLPNGNGGSTGVTPAELCGNGATSETGDSPLAGSNSDLMTFLSILFISFFAFSLIAMGAMLMRGGK